MNKDKKRKVKRDEEYPKDADLPAKFITEFCVESSETQIFAAMKPGLRAKAKIRTAQEEARINLEKGLHKDMKLFHDKLSKKKKDERFRKKEYEGDKPNNFVGKKNQKFQKTDDKPKPFKKFQDKPKFGATHGGETFAEKKPYKRDKQGEYGKPTYEKHSHKSHTGTYQRNFNFQQGQTLFTPYITSDKVREGIQNKTLFQGTMIVDERNPKFAFIKSPSFAQRVILNQFEDRNRAFHGSRVVFKVLNEDYKQFIITENANGSSEVKKDIRSASEDDIGIILESGLQSSEADTSADDKFKKSNQASSKGKKKEGAIIPENSEESENDDEDIYEDYEESGDSDEEADDTDEIDEEDALDFGIGMDIAVDIDDSISDDEEDDSEEEKEIRPKKKGFNKKLEQQVGKKKAKFFNKKDNQRAEDKPAKAVKSVKPESKDKTKLRLVGKIEFVEDNPEMEREIVVLFEITERGRCGFATPLEKKLPRMMIPNLDDIEKPPTNGSKAYYKAKYVAWPTNSKYPYGEILQLIGQSGELKAEIEAIIQNYNIYANDFTESTMQYLRSYEGQLHPETREYIIPLEERQKRLDLTNQIVFTCDPITARDLDDSLSIKHIEKDIYEVGIHIADVAHFVKEGTPLDDDARMRTTSVYFTHTVLPMLPRLLCENLCSLNPGVERLTFSIFITMKESGEVLEQYEPKICKTIIKSCAKLNYEMVQEVIEGKITDPAILPIKCLPTGYTGQDVIDTILLMNKIAQNIRKGRFEQGTMVLNKKKKYFKLENDLPVSYKADERKDSNFMVEEYMLLANRYVGKFLVNTCKDIALLRCHPSPKETKFVFLQTLLDKLKLQMDFKSVKHIQDSLDTILACNTINDMQKQYISFKMITILEAAKYFVVENIPEAEWRHFALNFDIYTHFTSPIRRYPDVFVHRLLETCLQYGPDAKNHFNKYDMVALMTKCNACKLTSRKVNDSCEKIFMCLYLKDNQIFTKGLVTTVNSGMAFIYVPHLETEVRLWLNEIADVKQTKTVEKGDKSGIKLLISKENQAFEIDLFELEEVNIYVKSTDEFPIDYKIHFVVHQKSNDDANKEKIPLIVY
jgi:DIS3-like exonuclease 2